MRRGARLLLREGFPWLPVRGDPSPAASGSFSGALVGVEGF